VKKKGVKIFLIIEGLLALAVLFQLVQDIDLLIVLILGSILVKLGNAGNMRRRFLAWIGWFMIIMTILSTFSVWVMLILLLLFVVVYGKKMLSDLKMDAYFDVPWEEKSFHTVMTKAPDGHNNVRKKQKWIGNTDTGNAVYEWDDINITVLMGDTIIDLGNTLLPNEENIVLIRKGIGKTRVIIPVGIGVAIHHSVLKGQILFNDEKIDLTNETVKMYSPDYDAASRKIRIVSNTFIGDLEVIFL
jgi:lia operon protein LiaF